MNWGLGGKAVLSSEEITCKTFRVAGNEDATEASGAAPRTLKFTFEAFLCGNMGTSKGGTCDHDTLESHHGKERIG